MAVGKDGGTGARARNEAAGGGRAGRSVLVKPPQLPVDDPTALGARDEEDISLLEEFFVKVCACDQFRFSFLRLACDQRNYTAGCR